MTFSNSVQNRTKVLYFQLDFFEKVKLAENAKQK